MGKFHQQKELARKQKTYTLTVAQIDQIKREATDFAVKRAFMILLGLTCLVLHNSFGFGKGRLEVVCERICCMFAKMDKEGGYTMAQIEKAAWDWGGIKNADLQ